MPPRNQNFRMPKCPKVKNPCKICLGAVTQKNGLQCCGACESWVHYSCLNYTPGRINDIKKGIIQVTCPCPDCKTTMPKEFRTDEPFSCTNMQCPANKPPQCGNMQCPTNNPLGSLAMGLRGMEKMMQTCPLSQCGKQDCKQHSSPNLAGAMPQQACMPNIAQGFGGMPIPMNMPMGSASDACLEVRCDSGCVSTFPSDMRQNLPMLLGGGGRGGSNSNQNNLLSLSAMEEMSNTVGLLSKQIKEIMVKMQQGTGQSGCGQTGCSSKGPKNLCPKPCYCPDNPKQC